MRNERNKHLDALTDDMCDDDIRIIVLQRCESTPGDEGKPFGIERASVTVARSGCDVTACNGVDEASNPQMILLAIRHLQLIAEQVKEDDCF